MSFKIVFDFADIHDVNKLVAEFELRASESINKLAPEKVKTLTIRQKNPWFNHEVHQPGAAGDRGRDGLPVPQRPPRIHHGLPSDCA